MADNAVPALPVSAVSASIERDHSAELALAADEYRRALQQRETEIQTLRKAAQAASDALAQAYADAERRGYAAGQLKGEKAGRDALAVQVGRVEEFVNQIAENRVTVAANWEDTLVETVFAIVCRIIGEHGTTRNTLRAILRDATAAARAHDKLTFRVHPDDALALADRVAADVQFTADSSVILGGCFVDSSNGSLDARFETQLTLLGAALKDARAVRRAGEEDA